MSIHASVLFDRDKLNREEDYEGNLMVSIKAEDPNFQRTPVCTVLVLDVSGSMSGQKISLLRETATKIVQNLTEDDEIAIVTFTDVSEVVLSRINAGNKGHIFEVINRLDAKALTNMSAGLFDGFRQINEKFKGVQRVMLLTDGLANQGTSHRSGLLDIVKNRDSECTISTFGFGSDADQELLADMAKAGGGNYYYITTSDIGSVFARELGGLVSCVAQNIEITVNPSADNEIIEILNGYTVEDKNGVAIIKAEDIYAEETKHVLVKMKIAKPNGKAKDRAFSIAHIAVAYDNLKSNKHESCKLNPKVKFVKAEDADKEAKLKVSEQAALLIASKAQVEAVKFANAGDFNAAQGVIRSAGVYLCNAVEQGSEVCGAFNANYIVQASNFTKDSYTADIGSDVRTSGLGMMRQRGSKGMSATLYCNTSMKNMEHSFDNLGTADPDAVMPSQTGEPFGPGPNEPPKITLDQKNGIDDAIKDAINAIAKPDDKKWKKNFSKKRKSN
jgi:Ca-activated chloride channel homolog